MTTTDKMGQIIEDVTAQYGEVVRVAVIDTIVRVLQSQNDDERAKLGEVA